MVKFLHENKNFRQFLVTKAFDLKIEPALVEKDYWIMHCLWGLLIQGFLFELKGGTSLSKGFGLIRRFSEDIDIRIEPPKDSNINMEKVKIGKNQNRSNHVESRRVFFDELAANINIYGIHTVERDTDFDDIKIRNAGIRLLYNSLMPQLEGVKRGILLEAGFADVTPNRPTTISSWLMEDALRLGVDVKDNRAVGVLCYLPGYTFVEKLHAISKKYQQLKSNKVFPQNFTRHYYDIFCLLDTEEVRQFIKTKEYQDRKVNLFRDSDEFVIAQNPAFLLSDPTERLFFVEEYRKTAKLYYDAQPSFDEILKKIQSHIHEL
jgi:hypothetical protein